MALRENTGYSFAETHDLIFCGTIQLQRLMLRQILRLKLGLMLMLRMTVDQTDTLTDADNDGRTD
jgi:hypothetical protein